MPGTGGAPAATPEPRSGPRRESKARSRRRLLDAALRILDEEGGAALTTTRVSNVAGLAQPSFYVHFDNVDDLLQRVVDEVLDDWRSATVEARRASRAAPGDRERFRATFRVPISQMVAHPQIFRAIHRNRLDTASPIGAWSRRVLDELRAELVRDLQDAGLPHEGEVERRRLQMVADGLMGMTAELVLGNLDGRYPDLEEMIDVLVGFSTGHLARRPRPAPDPATT